MNFGDDFAVIGRNPRCGCPLAIDMSASADAQLDFLERGLLVEIVPETVAEEIWDGADWPCSHHRDGSMRLAPEILAHKSGGGVPELRLLIPPGIEGLPSPRTINHHKDHAI